MALPIITADQRLAEKQGVKLVLLGKSGIGKTTQLKTLPEASTLFVDLEAGDLAVKDWRGDCVRPTTWPEFRDLVVFLAGPNPALPADAPYSEAHYRHVCERYGDPAQLAKYDTYFVDSITVLARLALIWAKTQPQAVSERTGKPDTRGAYGLLGSELIGALTHLQHARGKHVVFVAILDERLDDFNRRVFVPQIEGAKTAAELPGIVDEVVTLAEIKAEDGSAYRAFVTHTLNPYGYPAKDRSGQLELLEPPNLRALIDKCAAAIRIPPSPTASKEQAMSAWNDFNDAEQQQHFDLIPKGTVAKVRMTIKPGGHDDAAQGWTGGYATQSFETGSVYLAAEFVVLEGEYARRKLWSNIGLHSPKGPAWANMGRSFLRAALNSARNVHPQDNGPQAAAARRIQGFHELDGIEFLARIDVEKDGRGELKNVIRNAVEPDHPDYARLMGLPPKNPGTGNGGAPAAIAPPRAIPTPPAPQRPAMLGKPAWAQ